jgi:hypothetical protein
MPALLASPQPKPLFRRLELAFHTQYAEVKERMRDEPRLLPGTPGNLALKSGTGHAYWYRRYNAVPGRPAEDYVCRADDAAALEAAQAAIDAAAWTQEQVRRLRGLGLQVADKDVARLLVELHNKGLFAGGLAVVGTLAFMAWLNELGVVAVGARTQDVDLARRQRLKLGLGLSFLDAVAATGLEFLPIPGMSNAAPSTSLKRPGAQGLRVDLLAPGRVLGGVVAVPELDWFAQTVPHFDYLLHDLRQGALLAGGHCVPVHLPAAERMILHKLYSSRKRRSDAAKARKDLQQAAVLAAALADVDPGALPLAAREAPQELLRVARQTRALLSPLLAAHPQALEEVEEALA